MDFVVTMQGQKEAPPDMQCKDKFLIQSAIAPTGTTNKDVTPEIVSCLQPLSHVFLALLVLWFTEIGIYHLLLVQ